MLKIIAFTAASILALSPLSAAQKLGSRTEAPEQVLARFGEGSSDAELERAIAAASAFPLGSLQNPVRVGGPEQGRAYIARLRCSDGKPPAAGPGTAGGVGGFGSIVTRFELDCGPAAPGKMQVMMDMYHEGHREDRAPAGLAAGL